MAKSKKDMEGGLGIHARRAIAYIVLIIISFFCLFWFYIMFINATRSKGELKAGSFADKLEQSGTWNTADLVGHV